MKKPTTFVLLLLCSYAHADWGSGHGGSGFDTGWATPWSGGDNFPWVDDEHITPWGSHGMDERYGGPQVYPGAFDMGIHDPSIPAPYSPPVYVQPNPPGYPVNSSRQAAPMEPIDFNESFRRRVI